MQIATTQRRMLTVVEAARDAIAGTEDVRRRRKIVDRAQKQIERLRKEFQYRIDERAQYRAGNSHFPVNAREGIERKLAEATQDALHRLDLLSDTL